MQVSENKLSRVISAIEATGIKKYGRGKKIAEITGYSETRVSDFLSGKIELNPKFVAILCAKLGISENYIESGKGEMFVKAQEESEKFPRQPPGQEKPFDEREALLKELKKETEEFSKAEFYEMMSKFHKVVEELQRQRKGGKLPPSD